MSPSPSELFLDPQSLAVDDKGQFKPHVWRYLQDLQSGLGAVDLQTQVTGILPVVNGGTGLDNLTFTTSGATNVTLPTSGTVVVTTSPVTAVELTVTTGVTADSGGIKHKRITTGSITAGTSALVTVSWGAAFANANYTVVASVIDSTAATASLSVVHIETVSASQVQVRVQNTAVGDLTGTLQVIAFHD